MIKKIINNKTSNYKTWCGQLIPPSGSYELQPEEELKWGNDLTFIAELSAGNAILSDGTNEYVNFNEANKIMQAIGGVVEEIPINFNKDSKVDYVMNDETTYAVVGNFQFKGTNKFNPTIVKIIASKSSDIEATAYCRLYDIDNDEILTEILWTTCEKETHIGYLQSLSYNDSKIEIQLKTDNTSVEARLHALQLY